MQHPPLVDYTLPAFVAGYLVILSIIMTVVGVCGVLLLVEKLTSRRVRGDRSTHQ